ncbi:MAG: hypothetical protein ACK55I_39890, partial [bacterium]
MGRPLNAGHACGAARAADVRGPSRGSNAAGRNLRAAVHRPSPSRHSGGDGDTPLVRPAVSGIGRELRRRARC